MMDKKVVIVSGGSRGLGKGIIEYLLAHEFAVATFSRSETEFIKNLDSVYADHVYWESMDASNNKQLKTFVFNVVKKYGRIDGLVNNAGAALEQVLPVTMENDIDHIIKLNVGSVLHLSRYASRVMLTQNSGSIINISSIVGLRGFKGTSVYGASKAALDGFTRGLARELGGKGIRINSIAPGFMDTEMTQNMKAGKKDQIIRRTPLGRLGKVEDVVGLVGFLLSEEARFITGQSLVVDGGLTC